jgi:general stress protein 26
MIEDEASGVPFAASWRMGTAKNTNEDAREKLYDIVQRARTVLLLTHGEDHRIVGRPMSLVRVTEDSTIYLVASMDSKKVSEILIDPRVTVAVQSREGIAMIDGDATVSGDRTLIDGLWSDSWKVRFPNGKDDPAIAIVVVQPREGTYWDQDLGHGLSYAYRYIKARVTGSEMEIVPGDQQSVDLDRTGR